MTAATPTNGREDSPRLLHEFFERSARRLPTAVALDIPSGPEHPERSLTTYAELETCASRLARHLQPFVTGECVVAIYLPRHSPLIFAAQLAVLKVGAAFTCIDPVFPETRVSEILEDSRAVALLKDSGETRRLSEFGEWSGPVLNVAQCLDAEPSGARSELAPHWLTPASLAYVIYTSGTTGRPKGVMVEHASIANLVASDAVEFGLQPDARVAQTSSAAYDSSVEETWLAYAAGATLVVADDSAVRLGPDLVPWLRKERIQVLCPTPTLLRATGCEDPQTELPDLSLIYAGGEAMPRDLADRWAPGRRLENGYGPTECTVTALRGTLRAGVPVGIGRPIPGACAWALDEAFEESADGQRGELCIGGAGLARGYWNRPDLTAEKFVVHPRLGRIFRTGDVAHREADGGYICHGRADAQVKIRGYRIELEEIEARLTACPGVRAAACNVQKNGGLDALVAFVVPEDGRTAPSSEALQSALQAALPAYMVPSRFGSLAALPTTAGGKLDRAALPHLDGARRNARAVAAPGDAVQARLADAFRETLLLDQPVSIDDDFFTDLGGDSLRAAELITRLRKGDPRTPIAVRDVYEARTVAGLAQRELAAGNGTHASVRSSPRFEERASPSTTQPGCPLAATLAQAAALLAGLILCSSAAYLAAFQAAPWLAGKLGPIPFLLLFPAIWLAALAVYAPVSVFAAMAVKRCLIGRYRPLREPAWGSFYVRSWIVERVAHAIPWWLIEATGFQSMVLRALGARIGRRVHIHQGVDLRRGGWDLLEIGDDVSIGEEAFLGLLELEDGQIVVSPVRLDDGATVETRGVVSGGSCLEDGAYLTALSTLPPGSRIPAGQRWDGVPAGPTGAAPPRPDLSAGAHELLPLASDGMLVLTRFAAGVLPFAVPVLLTLGVVVALGLDAASIVGGLLSGQLSIGIVLAGLAVVAISIPISLVLAAALARVLGKVREGTIGIRSWDYIRVRAKTELARLACTWLAGSLLWPVWLRWAGAKIGRGCEISTLLDTVPELIEIGSTTFLADGIYLGGPRLHRGTATLAVTRIGKGVFAGNHVVIPAGQRLSDGVLLGICTVANGHVMPEHTSWFGHPPFELPKREVVTVDRSLTYEPSAVRYATRAFWELMRIILPLPPVLVTLVWLRAVGLSSATPAGVLFAVAPLAALGACTSLCLLTLAVKWILVGRVRPGQHPFWSCWCGRWDFMYVTWEDWARRPLAMLEGTLLLSWYLRAMGVSLGKRVVLGPGMAQVVDPDMLIIEDGATVSAMFQAHTFEDRVLKIDRIRIGRNAEVGAAAVPLYGAEVGAGAHVAAGSVIMKHEHLTPGVHYEGAPARDAGSAA